MIYFILFLVSVLLGAVLLPIGLLYSLIKFKFRLHKYFLVVAIAIDQLGNVVMQDLFNDIMITKDGYKFGNEDETISSVIGKNQLLGTLRFMGRLLNGLLNAIQPNHSVKSIEE